MFLQAVYHFLVNDKYLNCDCFLNHIFVLQGRRPKSTIVSQGTDTLMNIYVLPLIGKADAKYQVMDNSTIAQLVLQRLTISRTSPPLFKQYFVWKSQIVVSTARIVLLVNSKVVVVADQEFLESGAVALYNGPGEASDRVLKITHKTLLASFQAFVVVYTHTNQEAVLNRKRNALIHYRSHSVVPLKVVVNAGERVTLPQCTPVFHDTRSGSNSKEEQTMTCLLKNCHCVFNISSSSSKFVNVSFKKVVYSGPDTPDAYTVGFDNHQPSLKTRHCLYGGISFETRKPEGQEQVRRIESNLQFLCENYSSDFSKAYPGYSLMNVVSGSQQGMILVVFSYKGCSSIFVDAEVSETPCKGIPYHTSKFITLATEPFQQSTCHFFQSKKEWLWKPFMCFVLRLCAKACTEID